MCKYYNVITDIEIEAYPDENGDPIPYPVEVPIGMSCSLKEEYNISCEGCEHND